MLIDGVNVYDMFRSEGVRWRLQAIDVERIDRIEIVRGPGAALWGQNAVNGVINVFTRKARESEGLELRTVIGDQERQFHVRHGAAWGDDAFVRVWALGVDRDHLLGFAPGSADTRAHGSELYKAGFRGDFGLGDGDTLTPLGQAYAGRLGERHRLTFGLGYRFNSARLVGDFIYAFRPEGISTWSLRAFALDEIDLPSLDVRLAPGAELEENDLTGTEFQPTIRGLWTPHEDHTVWAAVSRAVRIPSLVENYRYNQHVDEFDPTDIFLDVGNEDVDPEELIACEAGWSFRPSERIAFDLALFHKDLDSLVTNELLPPFTQGANTCFPATFGNEGQAESSGFEVAADAVLTERWRIRAAHTHFEQESSVDASSDDLGFVSDAGLNPANIANLRSYFDLTKEWELDLGVYFVDSMLEANTSSYVRTDVRLGYRPSESWRFALGVQNANDPDHRENGGYRVERNLWFGLSGSN